MADPTRGRRGYRDVTGRRADPAVLNRRRVLQTIGSGAAMAGLAGCSALVPSRFEATPFGLRAAIALGLDFAGADHRVATMTRDVPVVGEVTIVNQLIWYLAGGPDRPLPLGVFSTPDAAVMGRALNLFGGFSLRELLVRGSNSRSSRGCSRPSGSSMAPSVGGSTSRRLLVAPRSRALAL